MRLLAFRFSAMGDVALTVPALRAVLGQNPGLEIVLATRKTFIPFFEGIPRLTLLTPDLTKYKGLPGLFRLYREMKKLGSYDAVTDLHDVLRTKGIRFLFHLSGVPVYRIDKGRREKRLLTKGKLFRPLEHTVERYLDVFRQAGLEAQPAHGPSIYIPEEWKKSLSLTRSGKINIGIAPCTRHAIKTWPYEKMIRLMLLIRKNKKEGVFYLFGGPEDRDVLERIASKIGECVHLTLDLSLPEQLALMQQMNLMISMDSANMHLAGLTGTPVLSIWGGTHPYAGFAPWGTEEKWQVQIPKEELPCRPCTIYGKGTCHRHDLACLQHITPEMVMERILNTGLLP